DPLHQPLGRSDCGGDPVPRPRLGAADGPRASHRAPPDRHGVSGIQSGRATLGHRKRAMRPPRLCAGLACVAAQVPCIGYRPGLPAARCGGTGRSRHPARRPALRRPAPARRHCARADAGAGPGARGRADLLARSQDLGRHHGVDRPARRRTRHPGDHQHPQCGAGAPLCRPHRRHVEGRDRLRRSAARAGGEAPAADLRRRRMAGMSDVSARPPAPRTAFPPNWPARIGLIALALYAIYAGTILDITWQRFIAGFDQGARFISRMFPPAVAPDKLALLYSGMLESLQIAILAPVVGVLLSLPLGLTAARNLAPLPLSWAARALIALFRTFHPVIVAILFVKAVGFGALAGVLALIVASLGLLSKLVAAAA